MYFFRDIHNVVFPETKIDEGWNIFTNHIDSINTPLKKVIENCKGADVFCKDKFFKYMTKSEIEEEYFTNYRFSNLGKGWKVVDTEYYLMFCCTTMFNFSDHSSKCNQCFDEQDTLKQKNFNVINLPCGQSLDSVFPFEISILKFVPKK
jgi:hypothetical protein